MPSKIVLDEGGMLGRIIIDDHSIVAAFKMRVRFNRRVEVLDPNGSVQTTIDVANRAGALGPLWKLTEVTDVTRVEMDENAFRIRLSDGSVIRSQNCWTSDNPISRRLSSGRRRRLMTIHPRPRRSAAIPRSSRRNEGQRTIACLQPYSKPSKP